MAACDAQSPALGMCHMNKHLLTYNIPHYGQQQLNRALQHCRWGNIQQSQQEALHWVTAEWKQSFRKEVSRSRKFLQESQNLHSDFLFSSEVLLLSQWRPSSKDPFTCQIFTVRSLWKKKKKKEARIQINNNAVYQLFFYFSWKKNKTNVSGNYPKANHNARLLWMVAGVYLYGCKGVQSGCQGFAMHLHGCTGGF